MKKSNDDPLGGAGSNSSSGAGSNSSGTTLKGTYTDGVSKFWRQYGEEITKNAVKSLDERAKYMITTCASLIVINFGLLFAFPDSNINVSPQIVFLISIILFTFSYFPRSKVFHLSRPETIKTAFQSTVKWKVTFQKWGFVAFFVGLLALAIANLIENEENKPSSPTITTTFSGINFTSNVSGTMSGGNISFNNPTSPQSGTINSTAQEFANVLNQVLGGNISFNNPTSPQSSTVNSTAQELVNMSITNSGPMK